MAAAIPLAIMGGKAIYGAVQAHKAGNTVKAAERANAPNIAGAQGSAAGLQQSGTQMTQQGMGAVNPAVSYYQTLLGGNRAQMSAATAAPRAAITDTARGAERSLEQSGMRGAAADQARGNLLRDRTSAISGLTTGVQGGAANQLAGIGTNLIGQGGNRLSNAGSLWAGLAGQGQNQVNLLQSKADQMGSEAAGSFFDLASGAAGAWKNRGGRPNSASGPYAGGYQGDITGGGLTPPRSLAQY